MSQVKIVLICDVHVFMHLCMESSAHIVMFIIVSLQNLSCLKHQALRSFVYKLGDY